MKVLGKDSDGYPVVELGEGNYKHRFKADSRTDEKFNAFCDCNAASTEFTDTNVNEKEVIDFFKHRKIKEKLGSLWTLEEDKSKVLMYLHHWDSGENVAYYDFDKKGYEFIPPGKAIPRVNLKDIIKTVKARKGK